MIVKCDKDTQNAIAIFLRNRSIKAKKLNYDEYLLNIIGTMTRQVLTLGVNHSSDVIDLKHKLSEFIRFECPWVEETYTVAEEGDNVLLIAGFTFISADLSVIGMAPKDASDKIAEAINARAH